MDQINAACEVIACIVLFPSIVRAWRLKIVQGVHWITPAFFWSYGIWNLFYYHSLEQWWSGIAAVLLAGQNTAWLLMVILYTPRRRDMGPASSSLTN
ncbi:MAG TPA: hypothetical protein VHC00_00235 [Rhizobiaceae bacterium]|nr:hypothetical protein [Rhizobiaceae bacterium]